MNNPHVHPVIAAALQGFAPPTEVDTQAQAQARQELRIQAAAAQACPKGYAVHWVGERQMECLKELP